MAKEKLKSPAELNYEEAISELKKLVEELESSELLLEEGIALFERGQALAARCSALLEEAELKFTQLSSEGFPEAQPDKISDSGE